MAEYSCLRDNELIQILSDAIPSEFPDIFSEIRANNEHLVEPLPHHKVRHTIPCPAGALGCYVEFVVDAFRDLPINIGFRAVESCKATRVKVRARAPK
ncbi:MAG: hypothetical protein M3Q36_00225 [bacterium]|nr:hypothetical protein [bacterium]